MKIDYQNGTSIRIDDNGGLGTFGLSALHQMLSDLRDSQQWTRIASEPKFTSPAPERDAPTSLAHDKNTAAR